MIYKNIYKNLNEMFQKRVEKTPYSIALKHKINGNWNDITWLDYYTSSKNIGMALKSLGLNFNDKVSILSNTRVEWVIIDMGIIGVGGVTVAIYQSNTPNECKYIIEDSDSKFLFVENNEQLEKIKEIKNDLKFLEKVILISDKNIDNLDWVITFEELIEMGKQFEIDEFKKIGLQIKEDDYAAFIYTSGTTGNPKGAIITHKNLLSNSEGIHNVVSKDNITKEGDDTLIFLPLAHVFSKIVHIYAIYSGLRTSYTESINTLINDIEETKPDMMGSVPRIYEKIYANIISKVELEGGLKKKIFYWCLEVGRETSKLIQENKELTPSLKIKYKLANKLVFNKLKQKFGGKLKFFISSGAPISIEIIEFFHAADILILELYGLTEAAGAVTSNNINNYKFGTVGEPVTTTDIKLEEDGEILVKGPIVMKGYFKKEEVTKEVIDEDGWFHTGDIGKIDKDGFLKITDRKKDIIITSAGKNIAPQNIENLIKENMYINQIIVLGDKKKYLVALLNINYDEVKNYANKNKISYNDDKDLSTTPEIIELINTVIKQKNSLLPPYSTIKYFTIVPDEFTIESGELTPSLKIKRNFCMKKYSEAIEKMYKD
jgi:long-chain acyl-CoA synthetase